MKKEMYDASIHIWQFSLDDETRIRCKNTQVKIVDRKWIKSATSDDVIWVVTYWENTESDNVIWETLWRKEQDVFYPWMDVYHTVKKIEKIRDSATPVKKLSLKIEENYGCKGSSSTIIAWAIIAWCAVINTLYEDLLKPNVVQWIYNEYWVLISMPPIWEELAYSWWQVLENEWKTFHLEELYQRALELYRNSQIDLLENLTSEQRDRQ